MADSWHPVKSQPASKNDCVFEYAKSIARPDCPKCHGSGQYQYSTYGTPHFTICDLCCRHDRGWWKLEKYYGENNGKWCCLAGCGKVVADNPDAK